MKTLLYKLLFFPILFLTAFPSISQPGSNPIVVLIHGRGQHPTQNNVSSIESLWKSSLITGLAKNNVSPQNSDIEFAWYGDLLGDTATHVCTHHEIFPQEARDTFDSLRQRGIQTVMNATALLPLGNAQLLQYAMNDVYVYLSNQRNQCAINDRVNKVLEKAARTNRPVVIIAHSLGSLIAYNILNRLPDNDINDVRLITIGSMLGMDGVRSAMLGSFMTKNLAVPPTILKWTNIINSRDYLSFTLSNILVGQSFPAATVDRRVNEPYGHDAIGYLTSQSVSQYIVDGMR